MDLWVVAVAAGAGYLTKYWQNLSRDRDRLPDLSSGDSNFRKPESPGSPFHRLAREKKLGDGRNWVSDERFSNIYQVHGASATEVASTSGLDGEKMGCLEKYEDCNVLSVSTLLPRCSTNENVIENGSRNMLSGDSSGELPGLSTGMGSLRKRSSLRTKHSYGHFIKPLSSLETCLMAQLCKEHAEMEEYVFSTLRLPSTPTMRPLFVTDGSRILSRANGHSFSAQIGFEEDKLYKEGYSLQNQNVYGVPPLPKIRSLELPKKMKKTGKSQSGRLSSSMNRNHIHSQDRSPDGMVLICLGISIGIVSSFITNKREADKLKELLKQTENLVQDLQEELEMKDSMTVKELANENYESQDTCDNSYDRALNAFYPELYIDGSKKYDGEKPYDQKAGESSESLSKIEAELEAELERLGLNMNTSSLEGKLSDLVELDPDFIADFAQGELRADRIPGQAVARCKSDQDASHTSTPQCENYAVSPRELSLRLHEVIQYELEERVKELEIALQNSQRKLKLTESGRKNSWKEFANSEQGYSSTLESPIAKEHNSMAQPLVMNLSGEALDAYNEAYLELMMIEDSEDQDSQSGVHENNHEEGFKLSGHVFASQIGGLDDPSSHLAIDNELLSMELFSSKTRKFEGHTSEIHGLNGVGASEDENSDSDDDIEKQLIKQIVEKTKKGSPVVLNAQRLLFSMDEK